MNILLLQAWLKERGPALIGSRIVTVTTYSGNLIGLTCRDESIVELLVCVDVRQPALALAGELFSPEPLAESSSFAKALRFHLQHYRLDSIEQVGFDRSVIFSFSFQDQYGQLTVKHLRVELAGNASNAYLLSDRGMVVSIMRRRKGEPGTVRTVVTGKPLPPPPPLGKFVAQQSDVADLEALLSRTADPGATRDEWDLGGLFLRHVAGCDKRIWPRLSRLLPVDYSIDTLFEFIARFQRGAYNGELFEITNTRSANDVALDLLADTLRTAHGTSSGKPNGGPAASTLDRLEQNLALAGRADEVEELAAGLIQASGDPAMDARQYLADWQARHPDWASRVDPAASLKQNALKLSRFAQRLRRGRVKLEARLTGQPALSEKQADEPSGNVAAGDQKRLATFAKLEQKGIKHSRYRTTDGIDMVVGANATSNDALLRALGSGNHLWFHVRDYAGSHVYLLQAGEHPPHTSIRQAAITAAYFSQGRKEDKVEVCYTPVRQVRRPRNAKPGLVLVHNEIVISVRPALFKELQPQLSRTAG